MSLPAAFLGLPLRQRKYAQTKLRLLDALLSAVRTRPMEAVTVREIADAGGVSEASFFNYFPAKGDLLTYAVQLWSLEMSWQVAALPSTSGALRAIETIFVRTAQQVAENPAPMGEIIAAQARLATRPQFADVTLAERLLRFPTLAGIEHVRGEGLDELLPPLISRAIATRELPRRTDPDLVLVALATLFLGAPVALRRSGPAALEASYRAQLGLLWAGLRAPATERRA